MGEVGAAAAEHPTPDEVKENGDVNGSSGEPEPAVVSTVPAKVTSVGEEISTKVASVESEVDENSQTSQPISSNGKTEEEEEEDDEGDETSQDVGAETEDSRPEAAPVDSENPDSVESMELDGDEEDEAEDGKPKTKTADENGKDPLEEGVSISNPLDEDSESKGDDEPMDVDASTNGHSTTEKTDNEVIDDDSDKPVSINSDSENEDDRPQPIKSVAPDSLDGNSKSNDGVSMSSKSNGDSAKQNGDCDGDVTILSDKEEDCVVIDDEDGDTNTSSTPSHKKSEAEEVSPRRSSRVRKSILPQDIATIDDDDDIEEIIDDPLNIAAAKKPRLSINQSLQQNSFKLSMTPQPQKSLLASNQNSTPKEPTLVIIDTNTLMNRSGTSISASPQLSKSMNSSYSSLPTGMSPNSSYNSPRSVLNPVAAANLISKNNPPPLAPVTPLLPALTDDMFVLEAPSFIVPYIYEKPPPENLREIVTELEAKIREMRKKIEEEEDAKNEDENSQASTAESAGKKSSTSATEVESESDKKKKSKRKRMPDDDEDWDEGDTSTDDEASDEEHKTKVLIKEVKSDIEMIKEHIITPATKDDLTSASSNSAGNNAQTDPKKSENYFENPLGKFFMNIGVNLVQEFVQTDLLRQQKKKRDREGKPSPSTQMAINSLMKNLELSKENNKPFKFEVKRCEYCPYKSESTLAMAHHYETPHMRNYVYKCNFCSYETRPPHDILYHMEAMHNVKGRLEKAAMYHACPNCPFEDNGKSKLARHTVACAKKFRPEINLHPPIDWEPPAKIPRIKPKHGLVGTATAYQAMTAQQQKNLALANQRVQAANSINPININNLSAAAQAAALRARGGRPMPISPATQTNMLRTAAGATSLRTSMSPGMVMPNNYQLSAAAIAAAANKFLPSPNTAGRSLLSNSNASVTIQNSMGMKAGVKPSQQPSISITPLPRQSNATNMSVAGALSKLQAAGTSAVKPGQSPAGGKTAFVVCEICDGYIKDLDQLRNHMQWIHKVKIHPKMIYNRPPLNCQKCQYRFFTDQGLERHLLGSHGLVTSSMQEAANKGKDAGRCPVCGRVYQWKLLNHVSRDHNMTLKPAHLSYKCTVCTATFGMYKQFESHVYSAHSTVAKKALDNKNKPQQPGGSSAASMRNSIGGSDSLLKPLKINDEITIIPQPAGKGAPKTIEIESHVID